VGSGSVVNQVTRKTAVVRGGLAAELTDAGNALYLKRDSSWTTRASFRTTRTASLRGRVDRATDTLRPLLARLNLDAQPAGAAGTPGFDPQTGSGRVGGYNSTKDLQGHILPQLHRIRSGVSPPGDDRILQSAVGEALRYLVR